MTRKAFVMHVHAGQEEEYRRRHDPIWPDLEATLKAHGAHHYAIFLDRPTGNLFAFVEVEDEARWSAIAETEVCRRWWASMKDLMASHPDNSPVARELEEAFYLD